MPSPASEVNPAAMSCSQQFSTWVISAMSAMEQPAFMSGRIVTWPGRLKHVGAFRHEMHAAEDDVLASGARGLLRQLVGVAAKIGEANDFVALIVMSKNHAFAAQSFAGGGNAVVHGVIGQDEVIFQTANCCCGCHCHVSPSAPDANAIAAIPQ